MGVYGTRYLSVIASEAGLCRISSSTGPATQIKTLQYASDFPLSIAASYKMRANQSIGIQRRASALMKGTRVFGEWHRTSPEIAVAALRLAIMEANIQRQADQPGLAGVKPNGKGA